MTQLPRNEALKVQKDEIRLLLRQSTTTGAAPDLVVPRTELETVLARVWADVLGVPQIGVKDDFFDLGGNSLSAMDVILAMTRETDVRLSLRELLDHPTVAGTADTIQQKRDERVAPATAVAIPSRSRTPGPSSEFLVGKDFGSWPLSCGPDHSAPRQPNPLVERTCGVHRHDR